MMGPWKVHCMMIGKQWTYIVCRQADIYKPEHSGNLIYADRGYTENELESERYAAELNAMETTLPVCRQCGQPGKITYFSKSLAIIRCSCENSTSGQRLYDAIRKWCDVNSAGQQGGAV